MTTILGIDPGVTSGWCVYNATTRTVVAAGQFDGHAFRCGDVAADMCVQERPKGYGPTRRRARTRRGGPAGSLRNTSGSSSG